MQCLSFLNCNSYIVSIHSYNMILLQLTFWFRIKFNIYSLLELYVKVTVFTSLKTINLPNIQIFAVKYPWIWKQNDWSWSNSILYDVSKGNKNFNNFCTLTLEAEPPVSESHILNVNVNIINEDKKLFV